LAKKEVCIVDTEPDLVTGLSNVSVAKRLKCREKEGRRRWKMRNRETDVGDGHCSAAVSKKEAKGRRRGNQQGEY